jgi:hypothetical protein
MDFYQKEEAAHSNSAINHGNDSKTLFDDRVEVLHVFAKLLHNEGNQVNRWGRSSAVKYNLEFYFLKWQASVLCGVSCDGNDER